VQLWSAQNEIPIGEIVMPDELHQLAGPWFEGRLALDWKPRPRESSQEILTAAGLRGPFWSLVAA
jgi:hypothetical protein